MNKERRMEINTYIQTKGEIKFNELTSIFPTVSAMTLRRDLAYLEDEHKIIRTRGGAKSLSFVSENLKEEKFLRNTLVNIEEKNIIARKAVKLIRPGRSVFLDAGSTILCLSKLIPDERYYIFTSAPNVAMEVLYSTSSAVNLTGGELNRDNLAVAGAGAVDFMKNVKFPEYKVERVEKGMTPYHTSVYSLVDDGFIALGDAACHTKPTCGEGCTSSLVAGEIAVEVISNLLKSDKYLTKERMWSINKRYMVAQGKDFDSMRPLLMGIISMGYDEAEYLFKNDIMFSEKILGGMDTGLVLDSNDIAGIVKGIVNGVAKKNLKPATIAKLVKGLMYSTQVGALYDKYPANYEDFAEWKEKADKIWAEIGSVAENTCDPEILKKLGYE